MGDMKCSAVFRAAKEERHTLHPFERTSAYKVRESWDNLQRNLKTVRSIAEYLRARPCDRHSSMLMGCTPEDKARRLRHVPVNIARELGYNLIPAVEALALDGVPQPDIDAFTASTRTDLQELLSACDAAQASAARRIKLEYDGLKAGVSDIERICSEALRIAERAANLCPVHGAV